MSLALGDVLLREIPASLIAGVQAGELKVYGSIIRSLSTGQIVGHLQETSALSRIAAQSLGGMPGVGTLADIGGHAVSYVQNEQIKAALNVVQSLQVANLALGAVGIGVSVAGFAIVARKIAGLEAKLDAYGEQIGRIAKGVDLLLAQRVADDLVHLRTLAAQMDEAWSLRNPDHQWQQVAREAQLLGARFQQRLERLGDDGVLEPISAEPLLDAYALASATRVSARLALGDDAAARNAANDGAYLLADYSAAFALDEIVLRRVNALPIAPGTGAWKNALDDEVEAARPMFTRVRDREASAAATGMTLAELGSRGIAGREWLETARHEAEAPLLLWMPEAASSIKA